MKPVDGPGSKVALGAIGIACICAECIPVMFFATGIAMLGVLVDILMGIKKVARDGNHEATCEKYNYCPKFTSKKEGCQDV